MTLGLRAIGDTVVAITVMVQARSETIIQSNTAISKKFSVFVLYFLMPYSMIIPDEAKKVC